MSSLLLTNLYKKREKRELMFSCITPTKCTYSIHSSSLFITVTCFGTTVPSLESSYTKYYRKEKNAGINILESFHTQDRKEYLVDFRKVSLSGWTVQSNVQSNALRHKVHRVHPLHVLLPQHRD